MGQDSDVCLPDGAATGRYMVCIARHVGPAEKTMPAFSLQQFTTKQDLSGRILACDTRFVTTTYCGDGDVANSLLITISKYCRQSDI